MTATYIKYISTAVVIAAFSISLLLLLNQNASLRRELANLRTATSQAAHPRGTNSNAAQVALNSDELRRLRKEHLELLSLRGRFTQLATELRQRNAAGTQANASPDTELVEKEADSILFTAALTNRVASGHTLVVGGWSSDGKRGYLLATPVIEQGDATASGRQLTIQSQVVRAPLSFWDEIGWGSYKSDKRRSTFSSMLAPEQLDSLIQALKEAKDADISNTSLARRRDGEVVGIGFARKEDDDPESGTLMVIDLWPRIAPDGLSVDLELLPGGVSSNDVVHGSLRQTAAPALSAPR
jgi:hypothetical protein